MRTKVVLVLAAVFMLIVGGTAVASNMGFKISIHLYSGGATNWVSLPYYNQYSTASNIFTDVAVASQVSRWNNSYDTYDTYGARGGVNFTITPGEAYLIKVSTDTNWIVVGSHNPNLALSLQASGASNWISIPYHTTATNASTLFAQIPNVTQVSRWDNTYNTYDTYGQRGGVNFTLTPGEGLLVKVGSAGNWVPPHY